MYVYFREGIKSSTPLTDKRAMIILYKGLNFNEHLLLFTANTHYEYLLLQGGVVDS